MLVDCEAPAASRRPSDVKADAWQRSLEGSGAERLASACASPAVEQNGLYTTTDGGSTWSNPTSTSYPTAVGGVATAVDSVVADPNQPSTEYPDARDSVRSTARQADRHAKRSERE